MTAAINQVSANLADLVPGVRVDDFTIAYRIRRGMNTEVFAVWHHGLLTPLICKRLRFEAGRAAKWRRLLRAEGAALARLQHPGIVRLINQNQHTAFPYLLLEHVGDETLRHRLIEDGAFEVDAAVRIVQHVGAAIAYAHEQGYLHRDLKPSNIIMRSGRPVLLDFGVVWQWAVNRRPTDWCGTPQYLSPEQAMREPLTPATDVYGLGVLLFELLTGVRPFRVGALPHDHRATLEVRYPQLVEEPLPLRPPPNSGIEAFPRALQQVVRRCLQPNPHARYRDVPELMHALDPFTSVKIWPSVPSSEHNRFDPFR